MIGKVSLTYPLPPPTSITHTHIQIDDFFHFLLILLPPCLASSPSVFTSLRKIIHFPYIHYALKSVIGSLLYVLYTNRKLMGLSEQTGTACGSCVSNWTLFAVTVVTFFVSFLSTCFLSGGFYRLQGHESVFLNKKWMGRLRDPQIESVLSNRHWLGRLNKSQPEFVFISNKRFHCDLERSPIICYYKCFSV